MAHDLCKASSNDDQIFNHDKSLSEQTEVVLLYRPRSPANRAAGKPLSCNATSVI